MSRVAVTLAAVVSLLATVAVAALWVRSYWIGDRWTAAPGGATEVTTSPWGETDVWRVQYSVNSGAGRLQLVRKEFQDENDTSTPAGVWTLAPSRVRVDLGRGTEHGDRWFHAWGFEYFNRDKHYSSDATSQNTTWGYRVVTLPFWPLAAASGTVAALSVTAIARRLKRRARAKRRLCLACGYDLRGNPASRRCPECGTPAPAPPALGPSSNVAVAFPVDHASRK